MTNPQMYQIIDGKRSVRKIYTEELIGRGDITVEQAEESLRDYQAQLEQVFKATRDTATRRRARPQPGRREPEPKVETAIDAEPGQGDRRRAHPRCRTGSPRTSGSPSCWSGGPR